MCWVLVRSGRARLEDVRRMGDAGRLVAARERFSARVCGEFGSRSDMLRIRGPKAGDYRLAPRNEINIFTSNTQPGLWSSRRLGK